MGKYINIIAKGCKCLFVGIITIGLLSGYCYSQESIYDGNKHSVAGKEFWVEKAEGGYWCYYGDDKAWWEPKPWHPEELKKKGPVIFDRWIKKDCFYPMNISLDERDKLSATEIYKSYTDVEDCAQMLDWKGSFAFDIIDPKGRVRKRTCVEWKKHYARSPEILKKTNVLNKRFIVMAYPEEVRGLGTLTIVYDDPKKEQDSWLYLPSVRKVRRMSTGAKQDFAFGMPLRNEDLPNLDPYLHNYKRVGTEIFKDPGPEVWGFGTSEAELKEKKLDGIGELSWILECTPGPKKWWFAKKIMYIGMETFQLSFEKVYDKSGALIRTASYNFRPGTACYPGADPQYFLWAGWPCHDLRTGYKSVIYGAARRDDSVDEECWFDSGYDEGIFSPNMLLREFTSTRQW